MNKTNIEAILLAAGMGTRLNNYFGEPKPLLKIDSNKTILEYSLNMLAKGGIYEAIIVVGYKGDMIKKRIGNNYRKTKIRYVENKDYAFTDTMHSFYVTKDLIDKDVLLLDADLLYHSCVIKEILNPVYENALVISNPILENAGTLVWSKDGVNIDEILDIDKKNSRGYILGEFIGIAKLSNEFTKGLFEYYEKMYLHREKKIHYENLFCEFAKKHGKTLIPLLMPNLIWGDADTETDYKRLKNEILPKINSTN